MACCLRRCRRIFRGLIGAVALLNFWGCSDLKFVTTVASPPVDDTREDIVLEGVDAQFTSGSMVQNRVVAKKGVYREEKGLLVLEEPTIHFYDANSSVPSTTRARTAVFYFAEDRRTKHQKGDVALSGHVRHIIPRKDDPTTAMVMLNTESLAWRAKGQFFEGKSFYRMVLSPPNAPSLMAVGDAFIASKDLRNWNVRHGGLTTHQGDGDFREENREKWKLHDIVPSEDDSVGKAGVTSGRQLSSSQPDPQQERPPGVITETTPLLHRLPSGNQRAH